jgi:hypothetical protein
MRAGHYTVLNVRQTASVWGVKKVTKSQAQRIRAELFRLVDDRILEAGCDSLMDFQRKHGRELFPEPLCPFTNRLCPDDLCYLPADHVGTKEGFHITGTVAYDYAVQWAHGADLAPVGTSRGELIKLGSRLAYQDEVADALGQE